MADMAPVHPTLDLDAGWVQKCYIETARRESFIQIQVLIKVGTTTYGREEIYAKKSLSLQV